MDTRYPISVKLIGTDGNAFALIGKVQKAIRCEVGSAEAEVFAVEAMSQGSYDELLQFIMVTVDVS